jgi:ketosteroid isomerase-like protein
MTTRLVARAIPGALCLVIGIACSRQPNLEQVTKDIVARENASFEAWKHKDKAFYDDYWASDMTEFLPDDAHLARKSEMMPRFDEMTEKWKLDYVHILDPVVRLYGDVAILTYNEDVSGTYEGKPSQYKGKVTMIYVKQGGHWRGVHYHESK